MKTSQPPPFLAWLVEFFSSDMPRIEAHKKFHVRLTDSYGQNYLGITPSISIIGADLRKPFQLVRIRFTSITKVTVEKELGQERYVPTPEGPKVGIVMEFNVMKMERIRVIENGKNLEKLQLTLASPSREQLVLSFDPIDFKRYEHEVLGNEQPAEKVPSTGVRAGSTK